MAPAMQQDRGVGGFDLVVQPPHPAQETLREHYLRLRRKAVAGLEGKTAERTVAAGAAPEVLGRLPEDLLNADSVG